MKKALYKKKVHQTVLHNPVFLFWFYITVNMVPSLYFLLYQPLNMMGKLVVVFFPLGVYSLIFSLFSNPGKVQVLLFPVLFLHAFQLVLFYLLGEDVIAVDMFLNVVTTNTSEVNELLGALLPVIIFVVLLYIPPTIAAVLQWRSKNNLSKKHRKKGRYLALISLLLALVFSFFSRHQNKANFVFHEDIYPVNLFYNLGFAVHKFYKIKQYPQTSKDFSYQAKRNPHTQKRQIIVLVIGETGRADNWGLYGYSRKTTPRLKTKSNLILFQDALTQSNVTHESVPIMISSIDAENYSEIYYRKGIFTAFKEAGFTTICLSNQAENGSFIEYFYKEADSYKNVRKVNSKTQSPSYDFDLSVQMQKAINRNTGDLFIVLHSYGSHFKYNDRYPENFRKYTPDKITNVEKSQKTTMVNAYDNSIGYTDYFLANTINRLQSEEASAMLLYAADHGEDLFDDHREKFLHSSPTPTYYQLRIPLFLWFSKAYKKEQPHKVQAVQGNKNKPISTNSIFPTLLNAADIKTPYLKKEYSLFNPSLPKKQRLFLTDHEKGIPFSELNLKPEDLKMLKKHNISH